MEDLGDAAATSFRHRRRRLRRRRRHQRLAQRRRFLFFPCQHLVSVFIDFNIVTLVLPEIFSRAPSCCPVTIPPGRLVEIWGILKQKHIKTMNAA